jgi:type IV pilus assembly protein PilF
VARKLLSLIPYCIICLALGACNTDTHASLQTEYPNFNKARANANSAIIYLHQGETDRALEKINLALEQAPNDPLVLDSAGFYHEKSGEIEVANGYFFKALVLAPTSGTIRNNYGAFLCRNGYSKASIEYFLQAARTPNYAEAAQAYSNAKTCGEGAWR